MTSFSRGDSLATAAVIADGSAALLGARDETLPAVLGGVAAPSKADSIPTVPEKLEGTTQTFGQNVVITSQKETNPTSALTTQAIQEGANQAGTPSTADFGTTAIQAALSDQPALPALDMLEPGLPAVLMPVQTIFVNPIDVLVTLIANTSQATVGLGCKEKATISMAAATSNKNSIVAVQSDALVQRLPSTLQGSALNSIATVAPNTTITAMVLGSSVKSQEEIKKALTEAQKIDLSITLRSKKSESIEFNTVKKPRFEVDFLYNFFTRDEEEVEVQEDQKLDPLLKHRPVDTPRYANLMWTIAHVTEPLAGTEEVVKKNKELRRDTFAQPAGQFSLGTHTLPFSTQSSAKNVNPFIQDGIQRDVADINQPERVFSAVANDGSFANSVSVTLNVSTQNKVISELPYTNINK